MLAGLLPNMLKAVRKFRFPGINQLRGRHSRTIISHDDLEIPVALDRKRPQHRIQRIFAVECRNNDGNQFGHRRPHLPALAEVVHADKPLGSVHASMLTCRRSPFTRSACYTVYRIVGSVFLVNVMLAALALASTFLTDQQDINWHSSSSAARSSGRLSGGSPRRSDGRRRPSENRPRSRHTTFPGQPVSGKSAI